MNVIFQLMEPLLYGTETTTSSGTRARFKTQIFDRKGPQPSALRYTIAAYFGQISESSLNNIVPHTRNAGKTQFPELKVYNLLLGRSGQV